VWKKKGRKRECARENVRETEMWRKRERARIRGAINDYPFVALNQDHINSPKAVAPFAGVSCWRTCINTFELPAASKKLPAFRPPSRFHMSSQTTIVVEAGLVQIWMYYTDYTILFWCNIAHILPRNTLALEYSCMHA